MRPRDWLWLMFPGACVGLLPACFSPASVPRPSKPFTGDPDPGSPSRRQVAQMMYRPAPALPQAAPAPQYLMPGAGWSPFNLVTYPPDGRSPNAGNVVVGPANQSWTRGGAAPAGFAMAGDDGVRIAHVMPRLSGDTETVAAAAPAVDKGAPGKLPLSLTDEPAVMAALRCFLEKRSPGEIQRALHEVDPHTQDFLMTLMPLAAKVGESGLNKADPQELAVVVDQLQGLLWTLRPKAALVMDKFCFCRMARCFGKFEALEEKPVFQPGEMVEVYAEIRNICSRPHRSRHGDFRTHLTSSLDIRRPSGEGVWAEPKRFDKPDETMTPQHDYYQHYRFQMPDLAPGAYGLKLEVVDVPTGRTVTQTLEFTIGPPKVARGE